MTHTQRFIEFFLRQKWLSVLLILGFVCGIGISTFYRGVISPKQRTDLTVFLKAGEKVQEGQAGQIYQSENARHWRYVYAPLLAILLAPFSKWPLGVTVTLAYLLSLACLAGTISLSRRFINKEGPAKTGRQVHASVPESVGVRPAPWQIALAMISCLPIFVNTLSRGQFGIITLFFAASIFFGYLRKQKVLTGILLAFAVALKISPLAFLVFFFLMKREWKILGSTALGFFLFFLLVPSLAIGFRQNWELLRIWQGLMSASQADKAYDNYLWAQLFTPFAGDNLSIYAVITRFAWPSETQFIGHSNAIVRFLTLIVGFILLALPFVKSRQSSFSPTTPPARWGGSGLENPIRSLAEFSLFPMLMLFTSPVTQIHHYTVVYFLFLAALMLMDHASRGSWTRRCLAISLWTCAVSLFLGMVVPMMGYWGIPLWGSMFLWGVVLCSMTELQKS